MCLNRLKNLNRRLTWGCQTWAFYSGKMVVLFNIIQITRGRIQYSKVDCLNFGRVLESVGFIREKWCLTHSNGEDVAANGTKYLKGGFLKGGLKQRALVTMGPYLCTMIDLDGHNRVEGYLC